MSTTAQFPFTAATFASAIIQAARNHCENTGDDHFVGDVQDVMNAAFEAMGRPRVDALLARPPIARVVRGHKISRDNMLATAYDIADVIKTSDSDETTARAVIEAVLTALSEEEIIGILGSDIFESLFMDFEDSAKEKLKQVRVWPEL